MTIDEIRADFALLDDWEDRYRYVIELGRELPPLDEALRTPANKVRGCASQVWLATDWSPSDGSSPALAIQGDSDAHIVRGLVAILLSIYGGRTAQDVLNAQRSNGLNSMVERIRADARAALAAEQT